MKFLKFKDEFIKYTGLMFIGISLFNLFNLFYHLFMVRYLPPIEYGHLNTLLALFMLISVPAGTVQTTITKFISSFQVQNKYDRTRGLLRHLLLLMFIIGFSFFLLISLGSRLISSFLQISSYGLVILFGLGLLFAMVIPVPWGGLQGLQKFGSLTFNLIINGALKFFLGVLFVVSGFGVSGAMGAIALSYFITTLFSLLMLEIYLPKEESMARQEQNANGSGPSYISEVYLYFFPVGVTLLCFMVLTNIDLILVKHFFTPIDAGYYSIAQMVGKIILFLPLPIIMVMFPKLSSLEAQGKRTLSTLGQNLRIAGLFCIIAAMLGLLFPSFIIRILSGKVYSECIPLVRFFSVNMTFFSLTLILLYYQLSTHERWFLYPLFFSTLIQTGLIVLFHKTLTQVLLVVGITALCLLGGNFYFVYRPHERRATS